MLAQPGVNEWVGVLGSDDSSVGGLFDVMHATLLVLVWRALKAEGRRVRLCERR